MITVICDSTAYITRDEATELGVKLVPVNYYVNGQIYNEIYSDYNGEFVALLDKYGAKSKTSQTNTATFLSAYEHELRRGNQVLCLTLSSRLSGTYSSASIAARELGSKDIVVVDSLTTAGGLLLTVRRAIEMVKSGHTLEQIASQLEDTRDSVGIAFTVDDMEPLRRSGRLGIVRQSVGTLLNIRPVLTLVEGSVVSGGVARGKQELRRKLIELVDKRAKQVVLHYIKDESSVHVLERELRQMLPSADICSRRLGPVLGVHLGTGVIGIAWRI